MDEPFKGVSPSAVLPFSQAGHNCAPKFKEGEEYIFYMARHDDGTWEAPGCHRTRTAEEGTDDLLFLRALPRSADRTRLSGSVEMSEDSIDQGFRVTRQLSGFPVVIRGPGGLRQTIHTSAAGVFELYDLPPGDYELSINPSNGLRLRFPTVSGPTEERLLEGRTGVGINLKEHRAVEANFLLQEDNHISGYVLDRQGKPLKDVCLRLEPYLGTVSRNFYVADCTDADGSFELEDMPAGSYRIAANHDGVLSSTEPFPTLYYPGVREKEKAGLIQIATGESKKLEFRITETAELVSVSGRFEFSDGRPVSFQRLHFKPSNGGPEEYFQVAADGSFLIKLLSGRPGNLIGELFAIGDNLKACREMTPPLAVAADRNQSNIVLTLQVPSCDAWKPRP